MRITNQELKLKVPSNKYMPSIIEDIRSNLTRMEVNGLSIDIRFDVASNVAMIKFSFKGKLYEMIVRNQRDVRSNMFAISKRVEYKARLHLLDIEPFDISVSPYLALENKSEFQSPAEKMVKASNKAYAVLGISEIAGNDEIKKKYKSLCKSFHPDMALSDEAKKEFSVRFNEISQAYEEICKERGI